MFFFLTLLDDPEEQQKFTEIYYQYRHFLWYVANQKLQDAHLAEDAVQEAFLALTRHMDKIEDVHSDRARNFLATIVRSKAVDILRKKVPEAELPEEYGELKVGGDMLDHYLTKENYHRLVACVLELDDTYRTIFEYKFMYQISDAEIADVIGFCKKREYPILQGKEKAAGNDQKGGAGSLKKQDEETAGNKDRDRFLARVLEECLDEDLSFVPPNGKSQEATPFQNHLKKRWISC